MRYVLLILALLCTPAFAAKWPVKNEGHGECAVLAANMQYGVTAIGQHAQVTQADGSKSDHVITLEDVIAYQAERVEDSFKDGHSIFIDEAAGKSFVEGLLRSLYALVKAGKLPADGVGNLVMMNCQRSAEAQLPPGIHLKGAQIES